MHVSLLDNGRVFAERRAQEGGIALYFTISPVPGTLLAANPIVFTEVAPENFISPPAVLLPNRVAQELMDQLWDCGVRPSEGSGSAGALAATQAHLRDTQTYLARAWAIVEKTMEGKK